MVNRGENLTDIARRLVAEVTGVTPSGEGGWAPLVSLPPVCDEDSVYLAWGTLLPVEGCKLQAGFSWSQAGEVLQENLEATLLPKIMAMVT